MASSDTLHWKRNLVLMWLSQLLILSGFAAVMPFIPLFLKDQLGIVAEGERGIYMSMFYFFGVLGYAMFCPIWGSLADRFGVRPMLLRGTFVTAFIFPLMGYVTSAWMLIALRFLSAACAGTTAAAQTLIVKNTPEDKQGFALGTLSTAIWGGTMLGNVIGGIVVHYYGYKFTFIACGIMYFIAGIFVLFAKDDFKPEKSTASPYVEKIRHYRRSPLPAFTVGVWLMFVLFIFLGFVRYFEIPYMAMMVEIIDGPANAAYWTGIISAFVAVGALLSGVVTGDLADKVRPSPHADVFRRGRPDSRVSEDSVRRDSEAQARRRVRLGIHCPECRRHAVYRVCRLGDFRVRHTRRFLYDGDSYDCIPAGCPVDCPPDDASAVLYRACEQEAMWALS